VDDDTTWKPKDKVMGGEDVVVQGIRSQAISFEPEAIPLNIVFEDDSVLVLNKAINCVVHPGAGNLSGTLLNGILYHYPKCVDLPRAGIVHRLDKDTSGLMVVAKTLEAHTSLVRQLQARTVKRHYQALVLGDLMGARLIDAPIGRHSTMRTKMAVNPQGKEARTYYRVLKRFSGVCTFIECQLETGRTHQIRVHCAHIDHPIVGDAVYNARQNIPSCAEELRTALKTFPRQALHAINLSFQHPESLKELSFHADLPQDFVELLARVEQNV
jgi:23S rRNA pseudouridine1911/1915/1917 synthase